MNLSARTWYRRAINFSAAAAATTAVKASRTDGFIATV